MFEVGVCRGVVPTMFAVMGVEVWVLLCLKVCVEVWTLCLKKCGSCYVCSSLCGGVGPAVFAVEVWVLCLQWRCGSCVCSGGV